MQKVIYNNVSGFAVFNNHVELEDVTSVGIPTVEHPTTEFKSNGMAMDVNFADQAHVNAMELTISHNNGLNCRHLAAPGVHIIEVRIARQKYSAANAAMEYESVKFFIHGQHVSTEKGTIERGNPYGSTEKFSVIRFVEEVNGEEVIVIDSGNVKIDGVDCLSPIESLLR